MQRVQDGGSARQPGCNGPVVVDEVVMGVHHLNPLVFKKGREFSKSTEVKSFGLPERHDFHASLNKRRGVDRSGAEVPQTNHPHRMAAVALAGSEAGCDLFRAATAKIVDQMNYAH